MKAPVRVPRSSAASRLIVVLWLTVLLTVIGSSFAYSMRSEALAARNTMSLAQARATADGAVERTAFELSRAARVAGCLERGRPAAHVERRRHRRDRRRVRRERPHRPQLRLRGAAQGSAPERRRPRCRDRRSARSTRSSTGATPTTCKRPNGAEAPDYQAAGSKYVPTNSPFESVGELQRVLGITPELMARIAGTLTVYSRQQGINPVTAPRSVLLALPSVTAEQVDAYIAARDEALENRLAGAAVSRRRRGSRPAPRPVWRIHVLARTPDGVTFVRDAVLRPVADPRRPLITLLWQEGAPDAMSGSAPTGKSAQENGTGKP